MKRRGIYWRERRRMWARVWWWIDVGVIAANVICGVMMAIRGRWLTCLANAMIAWLVIEVLWATATKRP